LKQNIPNCRKNRTPRVTDNKKIICRDRKDPICHVFLRFCDDGSKIEDQLMQVQNKNKIYFNNTNAMKERTGCFLGILYEFLFDFVRKKWKQLTSQNRRDDTHPLISITQGSQIRKEKLSMKLITSTFLFSSIRSA
jgi:hypothetical protein